MLYKRVKGGRKGGEGKQSEGIREREREREKERERKREREREREREKERERERKRERDGGRCVGVEVRGNCEKIERERI